MKFFVPQTESKHAETSYANMAVAVKDQLRVTIVDHRIFNIRYTHDKKDWHIEVGQLEQQSNRYEVVAIFESNPYVVCTKTRDGGQGVTILINKDEIFEVEDFE